MAKLPRITSRKVLSALLRADFYIHHQTGSHINLRHKKKLHLHIVIPHHTRDLASKTLRSIIAQAALTTEEFRNLLG